MRPDRSAMPVRPPSGPRPAAQPSKGRWTLSCSHPPKQGRPARVLASWRTGSPRRRSPRDYQVSPVPPPRPTRRPPRPPGWLATSGMHYTSKVLWLHTPGRHRGDDEDRKKRNELQTPTVYNFERQPLTPAQESLQDDITRRARGSSGAAAVEPADETRKCLEGPGLGLTAPRAAAHHRRPRRQRPKTDPRHAATLEGSHATTTATSGTRGDERRRQKERRTNCVPPKGAPAHLAR
jgi:hypothetical protein